MTITRRLKIAALVPVFLAALIGIILLASSGVKKGLLERRTQAHRIVAGVNELNNFVSSFVLHHEDRPKQQFFAQHDAVIQLIDGMEVDDGAQRQALDDMRRDVAAAKVAFLKLVSHYSNPAHKTDPLLLEVEQRLRGQILVRCRSVVSSATRLDSLVQGEITVTERRTGIVVFMLLAAAAGVLTLGSLRMMRRITDPLDSLRRGTEIIGRGDLTHRIGLSSTDEIGRLGQSFDSMAEQLLATTVSRDELVAEVEHRKRAEEQIQRLLATVEEERDRLRSLVSSTSDEIWFTDTEKKFTLVNPAGRKEFGLRDANEVQVEALAVSLEVYRPDGTVRPVHEAPPLRALEGEVVKDEEEIIRTPATGELRYRQVSAAPVRDITGAIIGSVSVVRDITERKRAEEALRELNATLEKKVEERTAELTRRAGQLQKLTLELSQAEERERRRISLILHEDLQQQIAGARFHLTVLKGRSNRDSRQELIDTIDEMLRKAIERSRGLSHDLSPPLVSLKDMSAVVEWVAQWARTRHGLAVKVHAPDHVSVRSDALAMFLFRAAQEMLFNVVKHAQVTEASIRVRRIRDYICLSVSDDGRGFELREIRETAGLGLLSIRERVELLGGRMRIKSAKGQGTLCHVVAPDGSMRMGTGMEREVEGQMADDGTKSASDVPSRSSTDGEEVDGPHTHRPAVTRSV